MKLPFLNRKKEIEKLQNVLSTQDPALLVLYGRRRCGKSRILQEVLRHQDVYFVADQKDQVLQRRQLSLEISRKLPDFDLVEYPSWDVLFSVLNNQVEKGWGLILDEFPYLVQGAPELPSILQKQIDSWENKIHFVLCGSSQTMMQGLVLDATAPLYGRAREILKIRPLEPKWIQKGLGKKGIAGVESFSVWGGVPRYWELARSFSSLEMSVKDLVLDQDGVLHNEPPRLLLDEMRSAVQANSLLNLIANGCHRLSEISSRLQKPASSLSRPLANLIDLGFIKRELPFGENLNSTKRSLYKIADPFFLFWHRFVPKNRTLLEQGFVEEVYQEMQKEFPMHVGEVWEDLARNSIARINAGGIRWKPGQRWWGKGKDGREMEIDVVAESFDGQHLLLGEVKWENNFNVPSVKRKLQACAENFPLQKNRKITYAFWVKKRNARLQEENTITPDQVLNADSTSR